MVASTHWLASAAGMQLLERGGNAFDAAVAAGFVLQVVEPHLNGPGGDLPIILYSSERDDVLVVCGQGPPPAAATTDRFARARARPRPRNRPARQRACRVRSTPGFGCCSSSGRHRLRDVLEPAIGYARDGHPVLPRVARAIAAVESTVPRRLAHVGGDLAAGARRRVALPPPGARRDLPRVARRGRGAARDARRRSRRRATRGTAASSPRRSTRSARGPRCWTARAAAPRAAHGRRPRRVRGAVRGAGEPATPAGRLQDRAVGPGAGAPAAARAARGLRPPPMGAAAPSTSTRSSSARSSRSPTARPGTATPRHRRPARPAALGGLRRRAPRARRGHGLARAAARARRAPRLPRPLAG